MRKEAISFFEKKETKKLLFTCRVPLPTIPGTQANGIERIKKFFWFFLFTKRTPFLPPAIEPA